MQLTIEMFYVWCLYKEKSGRNKTKTLRKVERESERKSEKSVVEERQREYRK